MKSIIIFTIDEKYIEAFIVAIESFCQYHDVNRYEIGLVHSNIPSHKINKIQEYVASKGLFFHIKKIEDVFKNIEVGHHFNTVIFYRLLLPNIFYNYKKILYIDSDILFTGIIDELFDIDLGDSILAAVPKHHFFSIPKHVKTKDQKYFASGLLLINTDEFQKNRIYEKCLVFLKDEVYDMPDQDALNSVVDKWVEIDLNYGVETAFLDSGSKLLDEKIKNPKIIQFSGSSKPWHFANKHPYKKEYWKYLKKTPFKKSIYKDFTIRNSIRRIMPDKMQEMFIQNK